MAVRDFLLTQNGTLIVLTYCICIMTWSCGAVREGLTSLHSLCFTAKDKAVDSVYGKVGQIVGFAETTEQEEDTTSEIQAVVRTFDSVCEPRRESIHPI